MSTVDNWEIAAIDNRWQPLATTGNGWQFTDNRPLTKNFFFQRKSLTPT